MNREVSEFVLFICWLNPYVLWYVSCICVFRGREHLTNQICLFCIYCFSALFASSSAERKLFPSLQEKLQILRRKINCFFVVFWQHHGSVRLWEWIWAMISFMWGGPPFSMWNSSSVLTVTAVTCSLPPPPTDTLLTRLLPVLRVEAVGYQQVLQVDLEVNGLLVIQGGREVTWQVEYPLTRTLTGEMPTLIRLAPQDLGGIVPLAMVSRSTGVEIIRVRPLSGTTWFWVEALKHLDSS